MEDLPKPCSPVAGAGGYAKKHDPFMYYDDVAHNARRCRNVVGFGDSSPTCARGTLPAFAFISPNLCHDTHDCGVATGDSFLSALVPRLLRELGPHGFLVLTWDEGSSDAGCCADARGGRIATVRGRARCAARRAAATATSTTTACCARSRTRWASPGWEAPRRRAAERSTRSSHTARCRPDRSVAEPASDGRRWRASVTRSDHDGRLSLNPS